ncbi:MAG: hypothetical protein IKC63_08185 [Clostridia bacterium]|nr:hypothetical protein [Clostridia bacterium]
MIQLRQKLKTVFYDFVKAFFFLLAIPLLFLILYIADRLGYVGISLPESNGALWLLVLSIVFGAAVLLLALGFSIVFYRDLRLLKRGAWREIEGVVTRFDFYREGGDSPDLLSRPVVRDLKTGEVMTLSLDREVEAEGRYLIYYLPNTKTAVVIKALR